MIKLSSPATSEFWEIPVLYEDDHLLVLDKPAGLPTAPEPDLLDRPSLIGLLHRAIAEGKPWTQSRGLSYLMSPHRLDLDETGVLLMAKTQPVLARLADIFGSEQPVLSFVTVVRGSPEASPFSVEAKIAPHPVRPGLMCVNAKLGKRARSTFEVLERFTGWTLLKCVPLTWRPHQLRVHLAYCRLPVAGDGDYRGTPLLLSTLKANYRLKPKHSERPLVGCPRLHAEKLTISHPVTGEGLEIEAPRPKDLSVALKYLRRFAAA